MCSAVCALDVAALTCGAVAVAGGIEEDGQAQGAHDSSCFPCTQRLAVRGTARWGGLGTVALYGPGRPARNLVAAAQGLTSALCESRRPVMSAAP
jgi:hypothetical protein